MTADSAAQFSATAARLYVDAPLIKRKLQQYRPYICPFDAVMEHVPENATVLDVGCGCGLFLLLLAASGRRGKGTGFDLSPSAIAVARQAATHLEKRDPPHQLEFLTLDALGAWPDGKFDVVSMIDVMHHVPPARQREVFVQACERTAPGGCVIYKDMCRKPLWRASANRLHDLLIARQWIHYADIAAVEKWASEVGFKTETASRINLFWYGHELRVFRNK